MAKRALVQSNIAQEHVGDEVLNTLNTIAVNKDLVSCGPVALYLQAGRDVVLSWPSLEDEKQRNRKGGEVDWFRAEVDRTQWAKDIVADIESLKDRPKNVVNDREMQTLRQRLSYAASVLRKTRGMASKIVQCEQYGFDVSLPDVNSLTRTTFPVTVIDSKKEGLPVQLNVRDFLNLQPAKGKHATELQIKGGRRQKSDDEKLKDGVATDKVLAVAVADKAYLGQVFEELANYIDRGQGLPKEKKVKAQALHLTKSLTGYLGCDKAQAALPKRI